MKRIALDISDEQVESFKAISEGESWPGILVRQVMTGVQAAISAEESHVAVTPENGKTASGLFSDPLFFLNPQRLIDENETTTARTDQLKELFKLWQELNNHPNAILDSARSGAISKALITFRFSFRMVRLAIIGARKDPDLERANGLRYDSLSLILRDADHIERYARIAEMDDREIAALARRGRNEKPRTVGDAKPIAGKYSEYGKD